MKVYDLINEFVDKYCADYAFGVPGSYIMPVWQNLNKKIVLCTNEGDAGYIASGLCRESRKPALLLTTASPGITNAISGIASAYKDFLPLIVISGAVKKADKGNGCFQEDSTYNRCFDGLSLTQNITKKVYYLDDARNAYEVLSDAFSTAMSSPSGCVHIVVPVDIQKAEILTSCKFDISICKAKNFVNNALPVQLENVIRNNEASLILCGWGVYLSNSEKDFDSMCKKLGYPVFTTMKGLYAINMSSPYFIGKLGMGYNDELSEFIRTYKPKNVIGFGTSFGKFDFSDDFFNAVGDAKIWSIGVSSENLYSNRQNINVNRIETCDMAEIMNYISRISPEKDYCYEGIKNAHKTSNKKLVSQKGLMAKSIALLDEIVPENILISADAGNHYLDAVHLIDSKKANDFWIDAGLAAMGNGICGTIGMAFAKKHEAYICITGDGCTLMNGNSIHIAANNDLPILFLVFNNKSLGRVRVGQRVDENYISSDIDGVDFVVYANALGAEGFYADNINSFRKYVNDFIENKRTTVIEILTDLDEIPMGIEK